MIQKNSDVMVGVAVSMVVVAMGCGVPPNEDVVETQGAMTAQNGLAANGLAANGLAANGLAANGLAANGLADPFAHQFMEYVVSCALPAGRTVTYTPDGVSYTFAGSIGVAPEWENSRCDTSCQRWVSACVLARLNKLGVHREISIRGDNDALDVTASELHDFSVREATYYGNLFQLAQPRLACLANGATQITRVCGDSLAGCAVTVPGACKKVCERSGRFGTSSDCAPRELSDGKKNRNDDDIYAETVTVFLTP